MQLVADPVLGVTTTASRPQSMGKIRPPEHVVTQDSERDTKTLLPARLCRVLLLHIYVFIAVIMVSSRNSKFIVVFCPGAYMQPSLLLILSWLREKCWDLTVLISKIDLPR